MTVDEADDVYMTVGLRSMRGEHVSAEEGVLLEEARRMLEAHLPKPEPMPQDVLDAIAEVKRMLGTST